MRLLSWFFLFLSVLGLGGAPALADDGWALADKPRAWSFPEDFGAHPEYRTEWWYFTGNLSDRSGSKYGYQLTFFRQGLRLKLPSPSTSWDIRDLYLAHFALTDVSHEKFRAAERISRAGPGLAGASKKRMDVWLLNWSAKMKDSLISLDARNADMEIHFQLRPRKPPVVHGENGYSRKGPGQGQASYYSSLTDLATRGTLRFDFSRPPIEVHGTSWFDQEFGSNQLTPEQKGWDWFSLHLSDGRDLMLYLLRLQHGSIEPASAGTLIMPDGTARHLKSSDFAVSVLDRWKSPRSGGEYPSRWRIQIAPFKIDLTFAPLLSEQELHSEDSTGITYWEGAVSGNGTVEGRKVSGEGYVELTGYAGSLGGIF